MDILDMLLDAIEHPGNYTEEELSSILSDKGMRDLYNLLCSYRASDDNLNHNLSHEEIENEWQKFEARQPISVPLEDEDEGVHQTHWYTLLFSRKIAAVIFFVIASCSIIAVGVSLGILTKQQSSNAEDNDLSSIVTDSSFLKSDTAITDSLPSDTVIVFENKSLNYILSELAPMYGVELALSSPTSKDVRLFLRWDSSMTLPELIDHLNTFERINLIFSNNTISD